MQRAGPFAGFGRLVAALGADPREVAAGSGIDVDGLAADAFLPFHTMIGLMDRAARATGCDHFGLKLGLAYDPREHGALYELMRSAPTLGQALLSFVAWQPGYSSGATSYLNRIEDEFAWGYATFDRAAPGSRHLYDLIVGVGTVMLRDLTGGRVACQEVLLMHRPPADARAHERLLRAPVRFNQGQACLVLSAVDLQTPLPGADAALHHEIQNRLAEAMGPAVRSTAARVKRLLRSHLLQEGVSFADMAAVLRLHPRTLRRRLADEGTTFEALLEDVRFTSAWELLDLTDMPVGDVAAALGYGAQTTFNHAFRRWSGMSPGQWRQRQARGSGGAALPQVREVAAAATAG